MSTTPDSTLSDPQEVIAYLQRANAELKRRLDESTAETREALEQQTATAEVLGVINSSPGDLAPVFDAMLDKAMSLCDAAFGIMNTYAAGQFRTVTLRGAPDALAEFLLNSMAPSPDRDSPPGRLISGEDVVQIEDLPKDRGARGLRGQAMVRLGGARSYVTVALRKDGHLLGSIAAYRQEVRPFTDKQIALLQNFAAQAVIAMENARLLTETREALEQQTATAEVLGVINSSPGDLTPVFDAMLEKAMRLCQAVFGSLWTYSGDRFRPVAHFGLPAAYAKYLAHDVPPAGQGTGRARLLAGEPFAHIPDLADEQAYRDGEPHRRALVNLGGARTALLVPLRKDEVVIGFIMIYRQEVRPFAEKQIALLQNFAAQAVIAMENARLITETREALEQQTATAEVLGVINSSPGDLAPVFDAMLEKALHLCEASFGMLHVHEGDVAEIVASRDLPAPYLEYVTREPLRIGPETIHGRAIASRSVIHVADLAAGEPYRSRVPLSVAAVELGGIRTAVFVPLLKDDAVPGLFLLYRQEVRSFSDKQIALLQNFAAQAVIAMENARLLGELRTRTDDLQESLEYQTATSDVLEVISRSNFDLQRVLDTLVATAAQLCNSNSSALTIRDGDVFRYAATHSARPEWDAFVRQRTFAPGRGTTTGRVALEGKVVHIPDVTTDPEFDLPELTTIGNIRTALGVPLLRDGAVIGTLNLAHEQVEPFTERQIELVRTFADQAVIAIENARLLGEIRQHQAELRVTFDNMADGVVMFDAELRLAAWNKNFQELLELPNAVLVERPSYADYLRVLAERGEFGTEDIEAELGRRLQDTDQELRLERARPDGRVIEVRRNAVPDGGFVLIYSDITERKRSEAEVRASRDAAETALRDLKAAQANLIQAEKMASLGQLTAGIAHEIKNPLNFVNNFASLSNELLDELKDEAEPALATLADDKRAEIDETLVMLSGNLEKIAEHGKRADNIVKRMLEHSRGVSGERREVDLNNLIEEALNLAYHGARAQNQDFNITLERDYAASLKPIGLAPQEITRVFLNLFGNGFYAANKRARANGDGAFHPVLAVATREAEDAVEVKVRDNGTGIAPEIRDKLFQPFFTTKPTGEGTGLGLSISYDIVTQQHGGTITVESEPGSYTEFTVRLPRQ